MNYQKLNYILQKNLPISLVRTPASTPMLRAFLEETSTNGLPETKHFTILELQAG